MFVRDAEGREVERRVTMREGGEEEVQQIAFEGTFGPGAECGAVPLPPPGIPEEIPSIWFDIDP